MVPVWVPIVVALIAALAAGGTVWATRRGAVETKDMKQLELALTGLSQLVGYYQEERTEYLLQVEDCRGKYQDCLEKLREVRNVAT